MRVVLYLVMLLFARQQVCAFDATSTETFAVAIDIDGVLKQGNQGCLEAQEAINELQYWKIPFVLMTNGGSGLTEHQYANQLNEQIRTTKHHCWLNQTVWDKEEVEEDEAEKTDELLSDSLSSDFKNITADQFVLSYTPWKDDLADFKEKYVLILGTMNTVDLAVSYGFKHAVHISEYARRHPSMDPDSNSYYNEFPYCGNMYGVHCDWNSTEKECTFGPGIEWEPFQAVLVFTDPVHLAQSLQLTVDVLLSNNPVITEIQDNQIPIYFASQDLLYKAEFENPRFGLGMFKQSLETIYTARLAANNYSENKIHDRMKNTWYQYGKPEIIQYEYVENVLQKQASDLGVTINYYFMIGDNPESDMMGAYNAENHAQDTHGISWCGVLVETGVYQPGESVPTGACHVATAVDAAVKWMIANPTGAPMTVNIPFVPVPPPVEPEFDYIRYGFYVCAGLAGFFFLLSIYLYCSMLSYRRRLEPANNVSLASVSSKKLLQDDSYGSDVYDNDEEQFRGPEPSVSIQ